MFWAENRVLLSRKAFSNLTGRFEMGMEFEASGASMNNKRKKSKWVERNSKQSHHRRIEPTSNILSFPTYCIQKILFQPRGISQSMKRKKLFSSRSSLASLPECWSWPSSRSWTQRILIRCYIRWKICCQFWSMGIGMKANHSGYLSFPRQCRRCSQMLLDRGLRWHIIRSSQFR